MTNVVRNMSRSALVMSLATLFTIAAAEARPARNSELTPSDSASIYQTSGRMDMQSSARMNMPQAEPMCLESRIQVPDMDGSRIWKWVEDCNPG